MLKLTPAITLIEDEVYLVKDKSGNYDLAKQVDGDWWHQWMEYRLDNKSIVGIWILTDE